MGVDNQPLKYMNNSVRALLSLKEIYSMIYLIIVDGYGGE